MNSHYELNDTADRELVATRLINAPRALLWRAFREPELLARWWGPNGFSNEFIQFDFTPGGRWVFTMVGPDGRKYPNESVFVALHEPEQVVIDHVCAPLFRVTFTLREASGGTQVTMQQVFETAAVREAVKGVAAKGNEQNLERLSAVVALLQ